MKKSFFVRTFIVTLFFLCFLTGCKLQAPSSFSPTNLPDTNQQPPTPIGFSSTNIQPNPSQNTPETSTFSRQGILPSALYFLRPDNDGITQVWRMSTDLVLEQKTFVTEQVRDFDISSDGSLAFVSGRTLYVIQGENTLPQIWFQASGTDSRESPNSPRWAPAAKLIAYSSNGIWVGRSPNTMRQIKINPPTLTSNFRLLPYQWSPDGRWLLVSFEDDNHSELAILDPGNNTINYIKSSPDGSVCCQAAWLPNSSGLLIANPYQMDENSTVTPKLYRANVDGTTQSLINGISSDSTINYVGWPGVNPRGDIYYGFANFPQSQSGLFPFGLYRASLSAPELRQILRPETYFVNQVLWSPDFALAVLVIPSPGSKWKEGGPVILVKFDSSPAVPLMDLGFDLKWGP